MTSISGSLGLLVALTTERLLPHPNWRVALGIGYRISVEYELPRLDLYYLVGGMLCIWLIGLFAAWQPARRASAISPAVATRTV